MKAVDKYLLIPFLMVTWVPVVTAVRVFRHVREQFMDMSYHERVDFLAFWGIAAILCAAFLGAIVWPLYGG